MTVSMLELWIIFVIYVSFYAVLSVHCSLLVTCWETGDILALMCVVFSCVFVSSESCMVHVVDCIDS